MKIQKLESAHQEQLAKLQTLTEHKDQLQMQLTEKGESINNLSIEVETYRNQLQEKDESISNLSMEVESFRNQLQEKEASLFDVSQDKSRLEGELQELDDQHTEAINQVISSKDNLAKTVANLKGRPYKNDNNNNICIRMAPFPRKRCCLYHNFFITPSGNRHNHFPSPAFPY